MHQENGHTHLTTEEASGGSREGVVRWVLLGGLVLAIGLLSITWIVPALMHDDVAAEGDVSGKIQAVEDQAADRDTVTAPTTVGDATTTQDGISVIENQPAPAPATTPAEAE